MLFRDCRFKGKKEFMDLTRKDIINKLRMMFLNFSDLSTIALRNYIELLILDSDFDKNRMCFVEPFTHETISVEELTSIAHAYIHENMEDFLKCC